MDRLNGLSGVLHLCKESGLCPAGWDHPENELRQLRTVRERKLKKVRKKFFSVEKINAFNVGSLICVEKWKILFLWPQFLICIKYKVRESYRRKWNAYNWPQERNDSAFNLMWERKSDKDARSEWFGRTFPSVRGKLPLRHLTHWQDQQGALLLWRGTKPTILII